MKTAVVPLAVPADLHKEIRTAAERAHVSMADVMRQSIKLGLPKFREQFPGGRITNVDPLPKQVARKLYSEPDDDEEGIKQFMAAQARNVQE